MSQPNPTPQPITDGLLVVFEGIDGTGKTTQLKLAQDVLAAEGWPVQTTRNLGGTPIGEELRNVIKSPIERPSTTNLYISVAIQEALIGTIKSERAQAKIILMDRGPLSLAAYEIYGDKLDESLGWQHVDAGLASLRPELTIIYDMDVETALGQARQKSTKVDYFESKPREFFERVAKGYRAVAKRYPKSVAIIKADQSIETIHDQTMQLIRRALEAKQTTVA